MKIFMVTKGQYSDYCVMGLYSTKEKAEEAKLYFDADNDIEEMELDVVKKIKAGMYFYGVRMSKNGDVSYVMRNNNDYYGQGYYKKGYRPSYGDIEFYILAKDEKHAIKIANEKRAEIIALDMWDKILESWRDD